MMQPLAADSRRVSRRTYRAWALAFAVFLVYGSVVPLNLRSVSPSQALADVSALLREPLQFRYDSDFLSNILLGVPLGYLILASLITDRKEAMRRLGALLVTVPCGLAVSATAEFLQLFSVGRTASINDVFAQAIGTMVGMGVCLVIGDRVTDWLRSSLAEREAPALFNRMLLAYCVLFALYQLMPFDLTISLGQLAGKYRRGMILPVPFSYVYASRFDMWWDYGSDVLLNIPVGAAAVLLWTGRRTIRRLGSAIVLGMLAVASIEVIQVFVRSRFADATDLFTGSVGIVIGCVVTTVLSRRPSALQQRIAGNVRLARVGVLVWIVVLMAYHWNPFNFTTDPGRVTDGVHQFLAAPFSSYYEGSELHALTEAVRKAVLAFPLGVLLQLSSGAGQPGLARRMRMLAMAMFGLVALSGIEFGQVFLPSRTPDITDAFIGEVGLLIGLWLTAWLTALRVVTPVVGPAPASRFSPTSSASGADLRR